MEGLLDAMLLRYACQDDFLSVTACGCHVQRAASEVLLAMSAQEDL